MSKSTEMRERISKLKSDARALIESLDAIPAEDRDGVMATARDKVKEAEGLEERANMLDALDKQEEEKRMDEERDAIRAQNETIPDAERDRVNEDSTVDRKWEEPSAAKRACRTELIERWLAKDRMSEDEMYKMREQFPEDRAFREWMIHGEHASTDAMRVLQARAALATGQDKTTGQGEEFVPELWQASVIEGIDKVGPMLNTNVVSRLQTTHGQKINYPRSDDTGNEGTRIAETDDHATQGTIPVATTASEVHTYTTDAITASVELVADSAINVEAFIRDKMTRRLGRIMNKEFTLGATGGPTGVAAQSHTDATWKVARTGATASATAVTLNEARAAFNLLQAQTVQSPSCVWMMSLAVKNMLAGIKETTSSNLAVWGSPNAREGDPDTLYGKRVVLNDFMDGAVAGKHSIIVGDFNDFLVRTAGQMSLQRLNEVFYQRRLIGWTGFWRGGTAALRPQSFAYVLQKS